MAAKEITDDDWDWPEPPEVDDGSDGPAVVAFVPAHNEADRVFDTVDSLLAIDCVSKVVVIDDASTDNTKMQALLAGATVLSLSEQSGKGAALTAGVSDAEFDYCLFIDADLGKSASEARLLLEPVLSGELDMSIARFPKPAKKVGFGKVKGLARSAIAAVDPTFDCQAPLSGQRVMTSDCLHAVLPLAQGYGVEVALTVRALRAGMRVGEVQTSMYHRATGNDLAGFKHRAAQYRDVKAAVKELGIKL